MNFRKLIVSIIFLCTFSACKMTPEISNSSHAETDIAVQETQELPKPLNSSYSVQTAETCEPFPVFTKEYDKPWYEEINTVDGLDGNTVKTDNAEIVNELSLHFCDFTFYREATGFSFDDESFLDIGDDWHKMSVGDTFGALTVSAVSSQYIPDGKKYENAAYLTETDANWCERKAVFNGAVTLTGTLYANLNEGAYWNGVLLFQADPESLKEHNFPLLKSLSFCRWNIYGSDVYPVGDTDTFYLGNILEDDPFFLRGYANENNIVDLYAEVELSNISMHYRVFTGSTPCGDNTAKMCRLEIK